jgi:uncharacterized protein GlcG (DUF336 family)/mannose-6-phosphate isomerase-like protein (cupin superfamily)
VSRRRSFLAIPALVVAGCSPAVNTPAAVSPTTMAAASMMPAPPVPSGTTDGNDRAVVSSRRALTLAGARAAIAGAVAEAKRLGSPGAAVAVVDEGGNPVASERLDGTFVAGSRISLGKARTAVIFKKPTRFFEELIRNGRTPMVALEDFTPLIGGIPFMVDGQIAGAIGVSGAASAAQDEQLAIAGANALMALLGQPPTVEDKAFAPAEPPETSSEFPKPPTAAVQIPAARVAAAFAKGMPLVEYDGYRVHASSRTAPGAVEIHELDTDILYFIEGSATIEIGGTVTEPKPTEPHEIRGTSSTGGETFHVTKGDVLIVPKGLPHWFKEVRAPLKYYAVKVK